MAAPTKATPAKRTASAPRKAARPRAAPAANGNGEAFELPTEVRPAEQLAVKPEPVHPVYGATKVYSYQPKDPTYQAPGAARPVGSDPIEFPHISTCQPTPLFFYDNRNVDEMHQAFAWMDLCGIPTAIGRRLFQLPDEEQGTALREWFGGLNLTPGREVAPPGES